MLFLTIDGVLSQGEAEALAERARSIGFAPAQVDYYGALKAMPSVRDNERVEFVDSDLAALVERRLVNLLGGDFPTEQAGRPFVGVGPRFRIYRYLPGQRFKPHKDGSARADGSSSAATVLIYLGSADGGETVLMPHGKGRPESHVAIAPRAGLALVFPHGLWHEGLPTRSGEKLVARCDLFYADDPLPGEAP